MTWRRLGRLYAPPDPPLHPALATHAANPLSWRLPDGRLRILYNGRDADNRTSIGAVDCDPATWRCVALPAPLFTARPGGFGPDGISIGDWLEEAGARHLLVMGWTLLAGGGWRGEIGRIAARADGTLGDRVEPLLAPDEDGDPVSLSYPCTFRDSGGDWVMLYESTIPGPPRRHPLHAARSADGRTWHREGTALAPVEGLTAGFARPTVLAEGAGWRLWTSRLGPIGERYHIATATSDDGRTWTMEPRAVLGPSGSGWDATMVCYPHVFEHGKTRLMLYNGDGFGRTGFGLAQWEDA